jgi:tetratricopeptide (TPR) repeat protein
VSAIVGKILEFIPKQPAKFGFERVKKRKKPSAEQRGQLNLFGTTGTAQVLRLPTDISPFEEALLLDERNDLRAEEAYMRAIEEGVDIADAYCNLGIMKSKQGLTPQAFDCFTKSLECDPRHAESHFNLGNLYFEEGDVRLARMHYELAAKVEPEFPNVYFNLGLVDAIGNDFASALAALKKFKTLASREEGNKADDLMENLQRSLSAQS